MGVDKNLRRASDYSSSLNIVIRMAQSEAPEGMMRIIDSMNQVVKTATEINTAVMLNGQQPVPTSPAAIPTQSNPQPAVQ